MLQLVRQYGVCTKRLSVLHDLLRMQVVPRKKVMLLARRDGPQVRFSLRAGAGSPAAKAPWKEEWGGGSSVENPHFRRVHYCELLVNHLCSICGLPVYCCLSMVLHCNELFFKITAADTLLQAACSTISASSVLALCYNCLMTLSSYGLFLTSGLLSTTMY